MAHRGALTDNVERESDVPNLPPVMLYKRRVWNGP